MIEQNIYRVTCDVKNCRNTAAYNFSAKGRLGKFYICKDCLKQIALDFQAASAPKGIKNAIKKVLDDKKESTQALD